MSVEYRVVELMIVTDETLARVLNEETRAGWQFEGIHFAMRDASRRPAMAFVTFVRRIEGVVSAADEVPDGEG